eukprot:CAMPEP_0195265012 /NCGR_PEP_ID=MMETSP0706-20130129/11182_1 /TAXON_ID=33640 /ORGANISM="Asterionellopsis glacialis, Strain CCMP134" /LENGTH=348 /DNA_ID=CAMNT_0040319373 /DNA_START=114 /DNA_END=1160 /DNA_ORIENTATION=-
MAKDEESIMAPKAHGTSMNPVQENLRWDCNYDLADSLCNFNSLKKGGNFEPAGYWRQSEFFEEAKKFHKEDGGKMTFYDSNSGKPLFCAPQQRSWDDFLQEASVHGWLSFRDDEVIWENVRCLKRGGITVSLAGTHLGSNMPDRKGNRYCINLVAIAGQPAEEPLLLNWTEKSSEFGEKDENASNFLRKTSLSSKGGNAPIEFFESQRSWIQELTADAVVDNAVYTPWTEEDDAPENDNADDPESDEPTVDFFPWPAAPCPKLPFGVEPVTGGRRQKRNSFTKIENTKLLLAAKNFSKQERDACSFGDDDNTQLSYLAGPEETFLDRRAHNRRRTQSCSVLKLLSSER